MASAEATRAEEIFHNRELELFRRTDRWFASLLACEWLAAIATALWVSPRAWEGEYSAVHIHVWIALFLGGAIVSLPIVLAVFRSGTSLTRHTIAVGQMLVSALLIHLTGGRIETHFHVFGSLAFLAFYRDWRVLISGSVVVAIDHFLRGEYWPRSVFGVAAASSWRWLEHVAWVVFEDAFLVRACVRGRQEMQQIAARQAQMEAISEHRIRQEQILRSAVELGTDGVVVVNNEGRIEMVNAKTESLFGYSRNELTGQFVELLIPERLRAEHVELRNRFFADPRVRPMGIGRDLRGRRKDGSEFPTEIGLVPVHSGDRLLVLVTIVDTTAVKRAAEELRLAKETAEAHAAWTRQIVDAAYNAFVAMDASGRITDWNSQAEVSFGWSRAEALGQSVADLIIPTEFREQHRRGLARFLETGEAAVFNRRLELSALHRNGHQFPVEITISPLKAGDTYIFSAFVADITSRKRVEEELRQAKEAAESANRAKSDFLANMSHEIRTPLNGILGMTELALGTELRPDQREYLEMVRQSGAALLNVINDILDFSKIEARKLVLDETEFRLRDALGNAVKALALRAREAGLELTYAVDPAVPEDLIGDPGRLRQIVSNLVGNAIKFTEHGEIALNVSLESATAEAAVLHFLVRDTGIGIPRDKLALIFQAFEQADTSTTRRYGGTGLGLAISGQLVELMGGKIWVESELGQGSTFHFTTRFKLGSPAAQEPTPHVIRLEALRVLIVDDNATNRRFFLDVLSRWKMRPEAVADGPAALERLVEAAAKQSPFDLILLDVLMPGMDGIAVAERIRQHPALATTPILILSSAHRAEDAERGRRLGVERYVTKPVTPSDLQNAIIAALRLSFEKCREALPAARAVPKRRLQILLAEDNEINQKLAVRLLERAGHEVTVVDHGADAVAEFERHPYDLILMDVQMPHMDGFAATAAIRAREHATGGHIPIVAMTAHALKGDRERCLAAGMDDYLAKPIQPEEVARVLDDVCNSLAAAPRAADGNVTASAEEESMPFDVSEALARVDGDRAFLVELAEMLSVDCHRRLETIRNALAANDSATWRREAHTLKGSFGTFAAAAAQAAAQQLESLADGSNGPAIEEAFRRLEAEIHRLVPALSKIARTHDGQAAGAS